MDFMDVLPTTKKGHDYLFVVVDMIKQMGIFMPCKRPSKDKKQQTCSLNKFRIPRSIILDTYMRFNGVFWATI